MYRVRNILHKVSTFFFTVAGKLLSGADALSEKSLDGCVCDSRHLFVAWSYRGWNRLIGSSIVGHFWQVSSSYLVSQVETNLSNSWMWFFWKHDSEWQNISIRREIRLLWMSRYLYMFLWFRNESVNADQKVIPFASWEKIVVRFNIRVQWSSWLDFMSFSGCAS